MYRKAKLILNGKYQALGVRPDPYEDSGVVAVDTVVYKANNPLKGANVNQNLPFICLACTRGGEDTEGKFKFVRRTQKKRYLFRIYFGGQTVEMGIDSSMKSCFPRLRTMSKIQNI